MRKLNPKHVQRFAARVAEIRAAKGKRYPHADAVIDVWEEFLGNKRLSRASHDYMDDYLAGKPQVAEWVGWKLNGG